MEGVAGSVASLLERHGVPGRVHRLDRSGGTALALWRVVRPNARDLVIKQVAGSAWPEFEGTQRIAALMPEVESPTFWDESFLALPWIEGVVLSSIVTATAVGEAGAWLRRLHDQTSAPPWPFRARAHLATIERVVARLPQRPDGFAYLWPRLVARLRAVEGRAVPVALCVADYKPANIFVRADGCLVPFDFPATRFAPLSYDILHFLMYLRLECALRGEMSCPEQAFLDGYGVRSGFDDQLWRVMEDHFTVHFWLLRQVQMAQRPDYARQIAILRTMLVGRGLLEGE